MTTLRESLALGAVEVKFIKADNSERVMLATTNPTMFSYKVDITNNYEKSTTSANVIRVWDIIKEDWRSIREDRVISWQV